VGGEGKALVFCSRSSPILPSYLGILRLGTLAESFIGAETRHLSLRASNVQSFEAAARALERVVTFTIYAMP